MLVVIAATVTLEGWLNFMSYNFYVVSSVNLLLKVNILSFILL